MTESFIPPASLDSRLLHKLQEREAVPRDLKKATEAFEALFIRQILKLGRGEFSRGLFGGGMAEEFFADNLDEERAKEMAASGGLGIAKLLQGELLRKSPPELNKEGVM
ncbi:MAG: rod-binding protein [Planctomycetes bacterium]|nr:rod-binding protein [Planctomycetota bacterium]